jgi:cupin fold WbuC family metalloprotein
LLHLVRLKEISSEVYLADEPIVKIGPADVAFLKEKLPLAPRGRVRICAHPSGADLLHEMIIALDKSTYIHPHKHFSKSESFHLIEGVADVVAFNDEGEISEVIKLAAHDPSRSFFYRLSRPFFHTMIIRSEFLIIHETTNGPFQKGDAVFAHWAPPESDPAAARDYMAHLQKRVAQFSPN